MTVGRAAIPPPESWPTSDEIAALLRARTKDVDGRELGRFTAETRPTDEQVGGLIASAAENVAGELEADVPIVLYGSFSMCTKLYAACLIEAGYFPEQIQANRSAYPQYWAMYERAIAALALRVLAGEGEGDFSGLGIGNLGLVRPYDNDKVSRLGSPPWLPELATASVNYDDKDPDTGDWIDR